MFCWHKYKYYESESYLCNLEALPMLSTMRNCIKCNKTQIKQPNFSWFALNGICKTYKWETVR